MCNDKDQEGGGVERVQFGDLQSNFKNMRPTILNFFTPQFVLLGFKNVFDKDLYVT